MAQYKNDGTDQKIISIPVEYDQNGTPVRFKDHALDPGEVITFDTNSDNGQAIVDQCIDNGLSKL